jgi:hypothetical protein
MNTIDELINNMTNAPDKFNHLKILLHREHTRFEPEFGRKYFYVSSTSFGLVKLNDLLFDDNCIKLVLEDGFTGKSETLTIDVNDKSFQFLMISWEDVQYILCQDKNTCCTQNDLLEFEF